MRRQFVSHASIVTLIAHAIIASSAFAGGTLFVDASSGGVPDGTSWCMAFTDLQSAIASAVPGDEIHVAGGEYKPDRGAGQTPGDRTASFALNSGVVLLGGYAGCGAANPDARDFLAFETILSGDLGGDDAAEFANRTDNSYHVVVYDDPNATGVVLDGFTVTAGYADGTGPAGTITNQGAAVHIREGSCRLRRMHEPGIARSGDDQQLISARPRKSREQPIVRVILRAVARYAGATGVTLTRRRVRKLVVGFSQF